jgi:hypothetical protein
MNTFTTRTYASSSAANRAIRQFEEKHGKSNLTMTKIGNGVFEVGNEGNTNFQEFMDEKPNVQHGKSTFRFFDGGLHGEGYYELKIGNRRRPNSLFLSVKDIFKELKKSGK